MKVNHIIKKTVITIVAIFTFISFLAAAEVPDSTVVAEFKDGKITMGDVNKKLSQIPPMYKSKYETTEGRQELLDIICTEEVFYLEAKAQKIMEKDDFFPRIADQIKNTYFVEYKKDLLKDAISYTEEEKRAYFKENHDHFKDRTYEEAEKIIETQLKPQKEEAFVENKKEELFKKYNVVINYDILPQINTLAPDSNEVIFNKKLISSSNPEIDRTVGDLLSILNVLSKRTQISLRTDEGKKQYIERLAKFDVFYLDAKEKGYDKNPMIQRTVEQIKRNMALRTIYNILVVESIDTSDDKLMEYYNEHIKDFSTLAHRDIQTFGFDSKKTAAKMRKKVRKLVKKNKEQEIKDLIAEHSVYPKADGILKNIYNNGIIPGIGKDQVYCDMVWNTKPDKISDIFQNSKDKYVFFRIIKDVKAEAEPFAEVKDKVEQTMMRTLSKEKFESVKKELEKKYNLRKYPDKMIVKLTAEEYFNKAEAAQKRRRFNDAIFYYDEVIKYHKNNVDDYKAMFMKGFLYAEELKDKKKAIAIFEEFLKLYPKGDLTESAEYMMETLKNEDKEVIDTIEFEDK